MLQVSGTVCPGDSTNDGVYPGKYKVLVGQFVANEAQTMSSDTVPMKYRNAETTPLEYEVEGGQQCFFGDRH